MKDTLRKQGLKKREQLSMSEVKLLSDKIISQIKKSFDLENYQSFGFYMPLGKEVDLRPLMKELLAQNKTVVLPKVLSKHTMEFYPIQSINDVHKGNFHVLEPNSNEKMPKNDIDILFIPGIHFSYHNARLGFGAGYYDRYLADYHNLKIGICFEFQYIETVPTDQYDIPMDNVITENPLHRHHDAD